MTAEQYLEQFGKVLDVHRVLPGCVYSLEHCVTLCIPCHRGRHAGGIEVADLDYEREPARSGASFTFWMPSDLMEEIEAFCAESVPQVTKRALMVAAIKEFLDTRGVPLIPEADTDSEG